jgi:hypothetical protein
VSYPTVRGAPVVGLVYREAQVCLGPAFAKSYYKFFLAGTSTPAAVYQNATLATQFSPTGVVTSDNYGRFPPIYLDASVIYKVQFFDVANTVRWTVPVYTPPLTTRGTSSSSSYGFATSVTGEVTISAPNSGGSGVTLTLVAGALGTAPLQVSANLPGQSALILNSSATTGAQTATFAATNKPGTATSSPAGWLPIVCDGVQYFTPIWHGNNFTQYTTQETLTALGESINATSVTLFGNGTTMINQGLGLTVPPGVVIPGGWYLPTTTGIGAGYYINVTKTGGLSGAIFTVGGGGPLGAWANIGTSGGITIYGSTGAPISGTYQLSTSNTGVPVVATGTITLSGNLGVQSSTWSGVATLNLDGAGPGLLNGVIDAPWYTPSTGNTGSGYWINITQTGGTPGLTFSAAAGAWTNITNGGITIGISGGSGLASQFVTGTYIIASDSGGVNQLGTGNITLIAGTLVQSPTWIGATPLVLAGNGSATLNGAGTSSWYSPNAANVGSGYWIKITRNSIGPAGVNFTAGQGVWTNIPNRGLTIGLTGTAGYGSLTLTGTYQISNNSSGVPVLGSGSISLSS